MVYWAFILKIKKRPRTDDRTDERTDKRTDERTDGRTDPHIEMRGRI